jgi:tetratricopeptide (TPR) repeat protein
MELSDKIDLYIQGLMPGEERRIFEAQISQNPHLATAVRLRKELGSFGTSYSKQMDSLIQKEDKFLDELTLNEWDLPENQPLVDKLRKIAFFTSGGISKGEEHWLKSEAIMYPELIEEILSETDMNRFRESSLSAQEIETLKNKLQEVYEIFLSIDTAVDDYLYMKHSNPITGNKLHVERTSEPIKKKDRSASFFRSKKFFLLSIAAVTLLLLSFLSVWILMFQGNSPEQLYASNYKPLAAPVEMRGDAAPVDAFNMAIAKYNAKDYTTAYASLIAIPAKDPNYIPACLFAGVSAMEMNKFQEAIEKFDQVIAAGETNLKGDAQWYQALCYLKLGFLEQSRNMLTALSRHPYYKERATKLLSEIKD